jgi:uncharacterized protein YecE (DUF72 family)
VELLTELLRREGGRATAAIYLGCSGWHYKHWRDVLYTSRDNYLEQYVRFFRSVEVNSTFYRFPTKVQVEHWYVNTPDNFVFSVKLNRLFTHTKRLRDIRRPFNDFVEVCSELGNKLGPFLVQLPATFIRDLSRFDEFLSLLPDHRFAFEFRHGSWFTEEVCDRIRERHNLTLVMLGAEFEHNEECFTDFAYIRWHGRGGRQDNYSSNEIAYWALHIRQLAHRVAVFGYWNNDVEGYAPKNCLDLVDRLQL